MNILVMNFFPAFFPPQSGGELRYFNMYQNLSNYYDVTLLSPTYRDHKYDIIIHSKTFREYRVPKEEIHDIIHQNIDAEKICSEISALVCYESAKYYNRYHDVYQELYKKADIIIHESPYMINYDLYLGLDHKIRIYNSYNFESELVRQLWKGPNADKYLARIREAEQRLVHCAELVFAISEEERNAFINVLGGREEKIHLAPNGIDVGKYNRTSGRKVGNRKKAFFIGSSHPPNIEAVHFIMETVAPECPDIEFYIAGKCCDQCVSKGNVHLLGLIDEAQKEKLFINSDIAINPMFSGAGTNLKTLEFLSAGIPLLSTNVGVRGLGLERDVHYIHAEKNNFAEMLKKALEDDALLQSTAAQGQKFIDQNYSWKTICNNVHNEIEKTISSFPGRASSRKKLLFLNDFEINHPVSGGEVRCFNIINGLSKWYDVLYVCLNNDGQLRRELINNNFTYISLPKTKQHIQETARVNSMHWVSADDIVTSYMINKNELVMDAVCTLAHSTDVIILVHPYMAKTIANITGKKIIYESYNFETLLKMDLLRNHPLKDDLVYAVREVEKLALHKSELLIGVSDDDLLKLVEFSERNNLWTLKIENGVSIPEEKYDYNSLKTLLGNRKIITFIGSGHAPNVVAAQYIVSELAPLFPDEMFFIIGSVRDAIKGKITTNNVLLFGQIDEKYKQFLLFSTDIALNPMCEGGGSNLKIAEYFAYKIPTLSTPTGVRGFSVKHQREVFISDLNGFPAALEKMLNGTIDLEIIRQNAFKYVCNELSWDILAKKYHDGIENLLYKKKLLVYTYRYNIPPRGGAEIYLYKILSYISKHGNYMIDVITTNIGDVNEQFRFSNTYTIDLNSDSNIPDVFVHKFPIQNLDELTRWRYSNELYIQFNKESHIIAEQFQNVYSHPLLMGGWYFPESVGDEYQCWTSDNAKIYVKGLGALRIVGYAPKKTEIKMYVDGKQISHWAKYHDFEIMASLQGNDIVCIQASTFVVENQDPRPLGFLVKKIIGTCDGQDIEIGFSNDYKNFLRSNRLDELISAYIDIANKRPVAFNQKFHDIRGPVSKELREWAKKNIEKYDVILGHSTPFNTIIAAQEDAYAASKPLLALPHFHMEDDFYHWKSYYDVFINASAVVCAPVAAKKLFFDKLQANAILIPGGGIDPEEFDSVEGSLPSSVLDVAEPYILVLGRKAGAKNYTWVIDAIDQLNNQGVKIHLVIIGRDEDKKTILSPNTTYLGEQSRANVLSALKRCEFVVNMSESESFGIVILEAWMSHKTVIVNEKCRAFTELVEDSVNGLYACRENLSQKIKQLLAQDRKGMAQKGYEKAIKEYAWNKIADQVEEQLNIFAGLKSS